MTSLFNYDPYYDDFDENKNFMRVLFRPGYSVQARELTQLQTILSNQIEKFGNHIFKSGSPIIGGKISLDKKANYIILESQYNNSDIDATKFLDKTIIGYETTKVVRAKVIAVTDDGSNPVLIIKYLSGERFDNADSLRVYGEDVFATLKSSSSYGGSYVASIQEGVYYFKGQFIKVVPQYLIVEPFYRLGTSSTVNKSPSWKIGIEFTENILDEIDDTTLLDPAQGAFNYQAPGATRYQIDATLSKRTLDSTDTSSFFEIIRIVDDVKTKEIDYAIYSELEKTMARRTYDESGNYTIDPFVLSLEEGDTANGKFAAVLDPGKAYVGGYEFETIAPTTIQIDRARVVSNVSDYDIPTNYESTIVLANVRNTIDITTYPQVDIHSIPWNSVDFSTTAKYNSSKIGTLRVNGLRYNDAYDSSNGQSHTIYTNVFGANSVPITGTLASTGSNTYVIKIPTTFNTSLPNDAYKNMFFRITDGGLSSVSPIEITTSNATYLQLATTLPYSPSSNTFSIESDFRNAESIIKSDGTYIQFAGNIDTDSKDTITQYAYINQPSLSSRVFTVPYGSIKDGTIANMDMYARKKYSLTSGADGKITITADGTKGDTFGWYSSTPGATISDSLIHENIVCFVRSDSAESAALGITANTVLALSNNYFDVVSVSASEFTANVKAAGVKVDLFVKTKLNNVENPTTGYIRNKTLAPSTAGAALHAKIAYEMNPGGDTLDNANTATITYFTGGAVFEDLGATNFDNSDAQKMLDLRTPGKVVSLEVPDVYQIVRITDSKSLYSNVNTAMLTSTAYDVTDNYEFDNGQKAEYYDHSTIKLKRGYPAPQGRVYVQYKYFRHPTSAGLFTVDSYTRPTSNIGYSGITIFNDPTTGQTQPLRASFDFRPTREIASTTISYGINPEPLEVINTNFDYYLSRIDRIVVKPTKEFHVITGTSSLSPIAPPTSPEDMLIYTLYIPAYTESVKEIRADFKNNRRYTMEDINAFDNRIRGLEYYVSLNSLEKDATATKILDANGLEKSKYGIFVDNFTTKDTQASRSEVDYDNRNLIDGGTLYPASLMRTVKLNANTALSSGSVTTIGYGTKKAHTLSYTNTEFAKQPYATKSTALAGALFAGFKGTTKLFPEFTGDVDTGVTAKVTLNSTQSVQNAFNFVNNAFKYIADNSPAWRNDKDSPFAQTAVNSWYSSYFSGTTNQVNTEWVGGRTYQNAQYTTVTNYGNLTSQYDQKQITTSQSQVDVGTFVTDLAIQPYMKPRQVLFSSKGLRPKTKYYSFFDDQSVNEYIIVPNKVTMNANSQLAVGEAIVIANTYADLASNVASLLSGGTNYSAGYVVVSEQGSANVSIINESGRPLTGKYVYGVDSGKAYVISAQEEHHSGVGTISSSSLTLQSDASSTNDYYNGNTLYIIHTTSSDNGIGESYNITSYDGSTKVATLNSASTLTGTVVYSIGDNKSNKLGEVGGAFYMPQATFRSGQRTFRVTESFNNTYDADSISYADKVYTSSGLLLNKTTLVDTILNVDINSQIVSERTASVVLSSRTTRSVLSSWTVTDPLSQTFYVDPEVYPYGMHLESVDLFFKAKDDDNLPVSLQIRPTVNGSPSSDYWYPESVVTKYPSQINVSDTPAVSNSSTSTNFTFDFPVYLKPGLYALVIGTNSPDYVIWEAEKGGTTVNNEFVDKQPYIGSLYKSQNTMEYVPLLNEDLMFKLNRCKFSTTGGTVTLESEAQSEVYNVDRVRLLETSINPSDTVCDITYQMIANTISGVQETTYRKVSPQIVYDYSQDTTYSIGYRRKTLGYKGDFKVSLTLDTSDDTVSPIVSDESLYLNIWENFVDDAEINSDDFTIINPGSGYSNSNVITITSSTGSGAVANVHTDANGNVVSIFVSSAGSGYTDDFSISYYTHPTTPASIVLNSEYDSSGGPCLARYITKPITLADGYDAGDLRVFLSANKPGNTGVEVYYKVLNTADPTNFKDRAYQKMVCINPKVGADLDTTSYTDYEFRPSLASNEVTYTSDNGITYNEFKTFAIKIVLTSDDPAIVPSVKNLRAIASPAD